VTNAQPHSLRWRLVRRLVGLQAAMLALLVLVVIAALWGAGHLIALESEDDTIDALRDAVVRDTNGDISVRDTPTLAKRRAQAPNFWFLIRDREGHSVSQGKVPREYADIGAALDGIGQARLGWNIIDGMRPTARMKWIDTPAGNIQILTGQGGAVSWQRIGHAASTLFLGLVLPIVALMSLTTFIATPIVVRRTLAGLGRAAAQAEKIDIHGRGARLPLEAVPSEIVPLVSAVNDALRRLDEGYERHQRFLVDAAHELRTPIAILQTRLESLSLGPDAVRVLEDVARLSTLADQLLDLQRVNQQAERFASVDLAAIARKVVADLAPLAIAGGYELSLETAAEQVLVRGDQGALERALTNLVQNAIQHGGRRGAIVVRVEEPATISVTDDGPGIPPADRERVFEPFYRLHGGSRGAGLGLNLVQEIVRLHAGQVAVSEGQSGGTCVRMTFKAAQPVKSAQPASQD
jgi:signal transduction histidine kinase